LKPEHSKNQTGKGAIFKLASRLSPLASLPFCILIGMLENRKVASRQGSIEVIAFAVAGGLVPLKQVMVNAVWAMSGRRAMQAHAPSVPGTRRMAAGRTQVIECRLMLLSAGGGQRVKLKRPSPR
jgi:hypothetical protein